MQGYEYLARLIHDYGITHYFYVEGVMRHTHKALSEMGVMGILAHSENAAGYMADGYARASQKVGVAMAQNIGSGNLAGGIYDAFLANSPVVAFTGKKTPAKQYRNSYQETDHHLLSEGITKFNAEMSDASQVPYLSRQLFREAGRLRARDHPEDLLRRHLRGERVCSRNIFAGVIRDLLLDQELLRGRDEPFRLELLSEPGGADAFLDRKIHGLAGPRRVLALLGENAVADIIVVLGLAGYEQDRQGDHSIYDQAPHCIYDDTYCAENFSHIFLQLCCEQGI